MFDNVAMDVFIGLVFIYLLYSLLAAAVNEFIAMIFAYRQRMLEIAIEQMLDGKNYSYYWWNKLANIFFWLYYKVRGIVKTSVKSQVTERKTDGEETVKSSAVTERTGQKLDLKDFFKSCNINSSNSTAKAPTILRSKLNKKAELFAANITNHPLYRRKAENSFLYKKPAYLTASTFSDILIDVLGNRTGSNAGVPVSMDEIITFVNTEIKNNPDLQDILNLYIREAKQDVQKFKKLIEEWYNDTMNRVSGWYKRQATQVLFLIGLIIALAFNVSTIDIVDKLSINKDLRAAMAKSASAYIDNANKSALVVSNKKGNEPKTEPTNATKGVKDRNAVETDSSQLKPGAKDSTSDKPEDTAFAKVQQQIKNIQSFYKDTLSQVNIMMGLGWDSAIIFRNFRNKLPKDHKDSVWTVDRDSINRFNRAVQSVLPRSAFNAYYTGLSVIRESFLRPILLLGFIITALAITMGAPFWFDVLNKFVNIRAGGNKPSEDTPKK